MIKNFSLKNWFENVWYYHKGPIMLGIGAILILLVFIIDRVETPSDLRIVFATENAVSSIPADFNALMPGVVEDVNGDQKQNITVSQLTIKADLTQGNSTIYQQALETQLANKGGTVFVFDKVNFDRMIKKDAFLPLTDCLDITPYKDRVVYRGETPIAISLKGCRMLQDMAFYTDDLYAFLLFKRPEDLKDPASIAEYKNAGKWLIALLNTAQ